MGNATDIQISCFINDNRSFISENHSAIKSVTISCGCGNGKYLSRYYHIAIDYDFNNKRIFFTHSTVLEFYTKYYRYEEVKGLASAIYYALQPLQRMDAWITFCCSHKFSLKAQNICSNCNLNVKYYADDKYQLCESCVKDKKNEQAIVIAKKWMAKTINRNKCNTDAKFKYVYIISNGMPDIYKIGVAKNPRARMKELQTSNHGKLKILFTCPLRSYRETERDLHGMFNDKREAGEWFRLSSNDLNKCIEAIKYNAKTEKLTTI